ncbi:MAG: DUF3472 domain-containing protein [Verrucomicrobiota bacterium]
MKSFPILAAWLLAAFTSLAQPALRVPAFTAYFDPDVEGAQISGRSGITGWEDPKTSVLWFGHIKTPGQLECAVSLRLPAGVESKLRLTVAGKSREATAKGAGDELLNVAFGSFDVAAAGYQKFALESLNVAGKPAGDIEALQLSGPAAADAQFNLKPRRNTASVHLSYPTKEFTNVNAFYCEVTATETPLWTYFEAAGWHRGYFGMQVNSPTERRIIFSVWDSGNEAVSRNKVGQEDRVTLLAKGEGVNAGDFGNEGTGGHSHLVYDWKTGEKQRFLVTAKVPDATHTIYTGYWYHPEQKKWMLISSWKAPKDGAYLHGLYSFVENFGGDNGLLHRQAFYGNQWLRTADGAWHEVLTASFSHDPTGRNDRFDRYMGLEHGEFFLSTGGFLPGFTKFGEKFTRPALGTAPADLVLPPLPE